VSQSTYELLKDEYNFEPRGKIPIKGKGEMECFLLSEPIFSQAKRALPIGSASRGDGFDSSIHLSGTAELAELLSSDVSVLEVGPEVTDKCRRSLSLSQLSRMGCISPEKGEINTNAQSQPQ